MKKIDISGSASPLTDSVVEFLLDGRKPGEGLDVDIEKLGQFSIEEPIEMRDDDPNLFHEIKQEIQQDKQEDLEPVQSETDEDATIVHMAASESGEDTKTVPVASALTSSPLQDFSPGDQTEMAVASEQVQVSYGLSSSQGETGDVFSSEAALVQAENLKVAQQRILELAKENEKLVTENDDLAAAGETFRKRSDEKMAEVEKLRRQIQDKEESFTAEMQVLREAMNSKDRDMQDKKTKVEELENRLSTDLKKVRVRERELENRLELMKLETQAIIRQKDETLMELKRKLDQVNTEATNYRGKVQELNQQIDENQEQFRRTVRALRLALTNLEVDEGAVLNFKKVENG